MTEIFMKSWERLYFYDYYFSSCTEPTNKIKLLLARHSTAVWGGVTATAQGFQLEDVDSLICSAYIIWSYTIGNSFKIRQTNKRMVLFMLLPLYSVCWTEFCLTEFYLNSAFIIFFVAHKHATEVNTFTYIISKV